MKSLVIVESPTKAKTISKYLGKGFKVESSFGHIRDLPKSKLGVDVENNFEPKYVIPRDKSKRVKDLKEAAKKVDEIYFATDEDREGEAISWHLAFALKVDPEKTKRITFHEITKHAIEKALENPRTIDMDLVNAQQARRILDRLVGYKLSPLLWHKVARGLSAGRVQSVAMRLIVEREREIEAFKSEEYWSVEAEFLTAKKEMFLAKLNNIDGKKLDKLEIKNEKQAKKILSDLESADYKITKIEKKDRKKSPHPPYRTSTLQQDANHKLGFSSKQTMMLAQQLYEGVELGAEGHVGLITYMRTDSTNLSGKFLGEALDFIKREFGDDYSLKKPRVFGKKAKGAQEAHEAIRPTDIEHTPKLMMTHLSPQQFKLYDLIWKRAAATQMADAKLAQTAVDIENSDGKKYNFRANGSTVVFDGFMKVYPDLAKDKILPELDEGEKVDAKEIKPEQHFTEPPARYSDATLVKILEEHGIGRPSTYSPTIATIEKRNYVERTENKRLKPTDIGIIVNDLLVEHFPKIVDYKFTAKVEKDLDDVADGDKKWTEILQDFYPDFEKNLKEKEETLSKKAMTEESIDKKCPECKSDMIIKAGRYGKFIACTGFPECKYTEPVDGEEKEEEQEALESNETCEKCGKPMAVKHGRYGAFLGCSGYPDCKTIKKIENKTGIKCPKCGKGEFVEKRSKRGKNFYGCNQYPDCENALWSKPTGDNCPECKNLIVYGAKGTFKCSSKECKYVKEAK